jgi:hypothetical protein
MATFIVLLSIYIFEKKEKKDDKIRRMMKVFTFATKGKSSDCQAENVEN